MLSRAGCKGEDEISTKSPIFRNLVPNLEMGKYHDIVIILCFLFGYSHALVPCVGNSHLRASKSSKSSFLHCVPPTPPPPPPNSPLSDQVSSAPTSLVVQSLIEYIIPISIGVYKPHESKPFIIEGGEDTVKGFLNGKSPKELNNNQLVQYACTLTRKGEVRPTRRPTRRPLRT